MLPQQIPEFEAPSSSLGLEDQSGDASSSLHRRTYTGLRPQTCGLSLLLPEGSLLKAAVSSSSLTPPHFFTYTDPFLLPRGPMQEHPRLSSSLARVFFYAQTERRGGPKPHHAGSLIVFSGNRFHTEGVLRKLSAQVIRQRNVLMPSAFTTMNDLKRL